MICIYALDTRQYTHNIRTARTHWAVPYVEFLVMSLSATKSREFGWKTRLVTDRYGAELMQEFGMSSLYDEILVELDDIDVKPRFWAAGKIHAYTKSIKDFGDGFIMCDNDAWFDSKPPEWVTDSQYLCQHVHHERGTMFEPLLNRLLKETPNEFPYDIYRESWNKTPMGGNAGFIVMRDKEVWELFKTYTFAMMASEFYDKLEAEFRLKKGVNIYREFSLWNVLNEEILLLECYRRLRGKLPNKLFDIKYFDFPKNTPNPLGYHHIWGSKRDLDRLRRDEKTAVEYIDKTISERIYTYFRS